MQKNIQMRGVRTHNLKNLDLDIPKDRLTVVTGLSGSGKSSLVFDTLYAEGQRRYVESLSAYARQFLSVMQKPDVDQITGLSPAIAIEQKASSHNPRSTVGTVTEIYDYLRLLYARVGIPHCPKHHLSLTAQTITEMVDAALSKRAEAPFMILAPLIQNKKGGHIQLLQQLQTQGFIRVRIDGQIMELDQMPTLDPKVKHNIAVVVDRFKIRPDLAQRLAESFQTAVRLSGGLVQLVPMDDEDAGVLFSTRFACVKCNYSLCDLEPRLFSFNSPEGACSACDGLGVTTFFDPEKIVHNAKLSLADGAIRGWDRQHAATFNQLRALARHYDFDINTPFQDLNPYLQDKILYGTDVEKIAGMQATPKARSLAPSQAFKGVIAHMAQKYRSTCQKSVREGYATYLSRKKCPTCNGARLKKAACSVFVSDKNLPELVALPLGELYAFFKQLQLSGKRGKIAQRIVKELKNRLYFLVNVGLDYLSLSRGADTLSGGETQRIRLASQIGSGLTGVMYVLDEPSIGLHQRDNARLLKTLAHLRDLGNTVIVVEHDADAIKAADHIIDMGPGAGTHGGRIIAQGTLKQLMQHPHALTGRYLSGALSIPMPQKRHVPRPGQMLRMSGVCCNNLKDVSVSIPIGLMTCVSGVSGSGKSSLINDTLVPAVTKALYKQAIFKVQGNLKITGVSHLDKIIHIDQSPIGRMPRSNPATYTGLLQLIRDIFAGTQEARARGYKPGRFSFNVKGGRCAACQGDGMIKVAMHFLADIYVPCDLCCGRRYNRETLEINYKGKNIDEVLNMTVEQSHTFFQNIPAVSKKLETLMQVGLAYIKLGQSATTLSGGEAQRIKLAKELCKKDTGHTLYIMDEPTTGLHFQDIKQLLEIVHCLRDHGNTVVIIEHNLDVIKTADWVIDLGPEGGAKGGQVQVVGTPEDIAACQASYTGQFLKDILRH